MLAVVVVVLIFGVIEALNAHVRSFRMHRYSCSELLSERSEQITILVSVLSAASFFAKTILATIVVKFGGITDGRSLESRMWIQ